MTDPARNPPSPDDRTSLDTVQLGQLEQSFRQWYEESPRQDVRLSRQRIYLIFLLVRYTGAKLNEVLKLNPFVDIDTARHCVIFHGRDEETKGGGREVQIPEALSRKIESLLADQSFHRALEKMFEVDPGFVRRKFYERTRAIGLPPRQGGPEMIRKARAVELLRDRMPLPAVQVFLGHSTPNLTSAYVTFSEEELQQVTKYHVEREFSRKTSACNAFFGKISAIRRGDIQVVVEIATIGGSMVQAIITHGSLKRLGLAVGKLVTAEIKAPWVVLLKQQEEPRCTAENRFCGNIERISAGRINTEYSIRLADGTELSAIAGSRRGRDCGLREGDRVWAVFNCYAVVLHVD